MANSRVNRDYNGRMQGSSTQGGNKPGGSYWGKAALAGIIGGIAMAMYEMIASWMMGTGFWTPVNMIGATFDAFRPVTDQFLLGATMTGMVLHLVTSAFWGLVFGAIAAYMVPRVLSHYGASAITGLLYGVGVWLVMGLLIGPLFNPLMLTAEPINYFIGHVIYGLVTALALTAMTHRNEVSVTYAPERSRVTSDEHIHH